jgi:hypothetical protein
VIFRYSPKEEVVEIKRGTPPSLFYQDSVAFEEFCFRLRQVSLWRVITMPTGLKADGFP